MAPVSVGQMTATGTAVIDAAASQPATQIVVDGQYRLQPGMRVRQIRRPHGRARRRRETRT